MPILSASPPETLFVSPSRLGYDVDCRRCFWVSYHGVTWPRFPMAGILPALDSIQKRHFLGRRTTDLHAKLALGTITAGRRVTSTAVVAPGSSTPVAVRGVTDAGVSLDSGNAGVGDYKTAKRSDEKDRRYARQMGAYAFAIEHPHVGPAAACEQLWIAYFSPLAVSLAANAPLVEFSPDVCVVEYDESAAVSLLEDISRLLDGPAPGADPLCARCAFITTIAS